MASQYQSAQFPAQNRSSAPRQGSGGAAWPPPQSANPPSSLDSLSGGGGGGARQANEMLDLQQLVPKRGRLGIEEIPFQGQDPVPGIPVPPPPGGWGSQAAREDALARFDNRNTQGIDGGGRSTVITRFTPQLVSWQQPDDAARLRMFERNNVADMKFDQRPFV